MKTFSTMTADHRGLEGGRIYKLALTGPSTALSYVAFIFLRIEITLPGGDATSIHLGSAVCVLGVLILEGFYNRLGGALEMTIGDLFDPVYVVYAPKAFLLKLYISLVTGLVAHKIDRIDGSSDKSHVFRFMVAASICGLLFNMIFGPLAGYYYKLATLDKLTVEPVLAWSIALTSINVVTSATAVAVIYVPLYGALIRAGFLGRLR